MENARLPPLTYGGGQACHAAGMENGGWRTEREKPIGKPAIRLPARPNDLTADNRSFGRADIRNQISEFASSAKAGLASGQPFDSLRLAAEKLAQGLPRKKKPSSRLAFSQWTGAESNRRHMDFQSIALPSELPVQRFRNLANEVKLSC